MQRNSQAKIKISIETQTAGFFGLEEPRDCEKKPAVGGRA